MRTTIQIVMTGSYERTRAVFDEFELPAREITEVVGQAAPFTTAVMPDSEEVRAKVKDMAAAHVSELLAVRITTLYAPVQA